MDTEKPKEGVPLIVNFSESSPFLFEFQGEFKADNQEVLKFLKKDNFELKRTEDEFEMTIDNKIMLIGKIISLKKKVYICKKDRERVLIRAALNEKIVFNQRPIHLFKKINPTINI